MGIIEAIIYGFIQGIAEFLPISSSGHLALAQNFFGTETENGFVFNIALHLATLVSVCVVYRKDVTNESLEYADGRIKIPDRPGLGIELNEEECLKYPYQVHTLRHYTGKLTDIRPPETAFYF